jgi:hypothetical protein
MGISQEVKIENPYKMRNRFILFIIVLVIVILMVIGFLAFLNYTDCKNEQCFAENQIACNKATWIKETNSATWYYKIKGEKDNLCEIDVKVLQIKQGNTAQESLNQKSMTCSIPMGSNNKPESDLYFCTGKLKEEMQTLLIEKLHKYIINNLGKISEELNRI